MKGTQFYNKYGWWVLMVGVALMLGYQYGKKSSVNKTTATHESPRPSSSAKATAPTEIRKLTDANYVVKYLQQHERLPNCYITKSEARQQGWRPESGNLCEVLPGKAIGGDRFSNRERKLPAGPNRVWKEADVNYPCGHRTADRVVFSDDGLIYLTTDHYHTFKKQ